MSPRSQLVTDDLDETLDAAAQVTPQDLAASQEFWRYWGTPLLKAMLDAEAEPETGQGTPP